MSAQIVTLDSPDTLILSEEAQAAPGVHAGSRVSVVLDDGRVMLQPLEEDDIDLLAGSLSSSRRIAADHEPLRGILAGGPNLVDELQQERRFES